MFAEIFIAGVFIFIFYVLLIYTYMFPEESFFAGRRWMYENPELSEEGIEHTKKMAKYAIIFLTGVVVLLIISLFR